MTEREGNTNAQRVEEREVRSARASGYAPLEEERGTSWVSVVLGWLAALGAGLILSGIVGAVVGGILGVLGVRGGTEGGVAGLVGVLVTLLLAFLIGGYVAGRLASRSGLKHGILVPVLSLLVILVLAIVGTILGASFIDQLSGVALPQVPGNVQNQIPQQGLGTILTASGFAALLVPLIGGALGGLWGAKPAAIDRSKTASKLEIRSKNASSNAITIGRARRHPGGTSGAPRRHPHPRHRLHHRRGHLGDLCDLGRFGAVHSLHPADHSGDPDPRARHSAGQLRCRNSPGGHREQRHRQRRAVRHHRVCGLRCPHPARDSP